MSTDPQAVLRDAREYTERGAYREALEMYRWFEEHALEIDPSWRGVRGSLIFRRWAELGNLYPPAREELESIRDARDRALREGALSTDQFGDVESINNVLGQVEKTRNLFAELAKTNRDFATKCFPSALASLVYTQDFGLAYDFLPLPRGFLSRSLRELEFNVSDLPCPIPESLIPMRRAYIGIHAEDLYRVLSVLVGVGRIEEATALCAESLACIADPVIRSEISDQLKAFSQESNLESLLGNL